MIYLDHHAATPLCASAFRAMEDACDEAWGNPSSPHAAGRAARRLLERARTQIADALGAAPSEVVLASGGTEACNLGLRGFARGHRRHAVTTSVEHPAVARVLDTLERDGLAVTRLPVPAGRPPSADELAHALRPDTAFCALQWINHETGTLFPIAEYAQVCRDASVPLFVDATQALGKVPIDIRALGVDLLALASHKVGGPAGAGALWIRHGIELEPFVLGGGQERGRRAGTPDVLSAIGFGAACAELDQRLAAQTRLARLRARAVVGLRERSGVVNGGDGPSCATVVNASFEHRRGDELVAALDLEGVCVSSGAACSSGLNEPSPVLLAMHPAESWRAGSALRLSFGPETIETDLENALAALSRVLARRAA